MYFFNDIRVEFQLNAERNTGIRFLQQHSRFSMPFFSANWAMLNVDFFFFFFLNPLKIFLPYPQAAMILHKSEQICYICLQSNIVCITPSHISPAPKIKMLNFQCFYNHHSNGNHPLSLATAIS